MSMNADNKNGGLASLKARRKENFARLQEWVQNEWLEIIKDKMVDVAARLGIEMTDDAKVKSHRLRK